MKQVTQKLKRGDIDVIDVPIPEPQNGEILVRNMYSCISPGTESSTVKAARKGYIGKAQERPEQFKQVLEKFRTQGILQTYRAVMRKLDAHSPLGYSCAGRVIEVGNGVHDFAVGDVVACGGSSACHAEIVSVPRHLCVGVHPDVDVRQAAYNSIGAIAMQGIRQADIRLGEICAVIGLGIVGQVTGALLKAGGVKVVGIDVNPSMVEMAERSCFDQAYLRDDAGIKQGIFNFTDGMGCDAVIITAASDSIDPVNFAGCIARRRGTVVIVGAVPTGFDREPYYYKKELTVKMSCSYGPGRYDLTYEEKGRDYPYAYVRWTEKRNMQAFQEFLASKKININYLTTHVFKLDDVPKAYDMMLERAEAFAGILIEYEAAKESRRERIELFKSKGKDGNRNVTASIGFIGAGNYAQGYLLPNIPRGRGIALKGVMTKTPAGSRSVADRFGFEFCTSSVEDILQNDEINTVFIATRHDSHGKYVIDALKAGKHVYVEKPLCLELEELSEIAGLMAKESEGGCPNLMVGYNRRFSPLSDTVKDKLKSEPMAMIYRINSGAIEADSWIQDPEVGGGRIIGEVCHFIDYLTFLSGSTPRSVYAAYMRAPGNLNDTLSISVKYQNGSIGNIHYLANGSKLVPKEYVEVYQSGVTIVINDFRELSIFGDRKPFRTKLLAQDKGQKKEVQQFIANIREGKRAPISFEEIYTTSIVSFKVLESLQSSVVVNL